MKETSFDVNLFYEKQNKSKTVLTHGPGDLLPVAEKSFVSQSHVYVHMAIWLYGDLI